jgi:hypothetical protein
MMVGMTGQQKGGIVVQGCKKQLGSCFKKENVDFVLDGSLNDGWYDWTTKRWNS